MFRQFDSTFFLGLVLQPNSETSEGKSSAERVGISLELPVSSKRQAFDDQNYQMKHQKS